MSLVTTRVTKLTTCAECGGNRVTAITMTLTDGSVVDFASCHSCEHRSWTQAGRRLPFDAVLVKATKDRR